MLCIKSRVLEADDLGATLGPRRVKRPRPQLGASGLQRSAHSDLGLLLLISSIAHCLSQFGILQKR